MAVETVTLNDGNKMPVLGLGTWQAKDGDECKAAVHAALDAGYRHIDTAYSYGNETYIGEALHDYFESGKLKREDVFITTKLWITYHEPDRVPLCMAESLKRLQLEYVDLYLIHFPGALKQNENGDLFPVDKDNKIAVNDVNIEDTWKAMEQLVKDGKTKSIGVSNFNLDQVERICQIAEIKPVTNQVECHIYFQQREMQRFLQERGITLTSFGPFGSPGRERKKEGEPKVLEDPVAKEMAAKYKKSIPQILLRHLIQRGIFVIPKSVNKGRIQENSEVFDFHLTDDEMDKLDSRDKNHRLFLMEIFKGHNEFPF